MRGRKNPDRNKSNVLLPPCRVCGEKGSGFHYGVTTCGACKGFFRRSLVRDEPYVCMMTHLCKVGPSTSRRQSCPKCRYDKCISVGMSKGACKVGRYSLVKKSKDIAEMLKHHQTSPSGPDSGLAIASSRVHSNSLTISEFSSNSRDNDALSVSASSSSASDCADYDAPSDLATIEFESPSAITTSSSAFLQERHNLMETSSCNASKRLKSDAYSDIFRYKSKHPYRNEEQFFGKKNFYPKSEKYPPGFHSTTTTSSSSTSSSSSSSSPFSSVTPCLFDNLSTSGVEPSSGFEPMFNRTPKSQYPVMEATNLSSLYASSLSVVNYETSGFHSSAVAIPKTSSSPDSEFCPTSSPAQTPSSSFFDHDDVSSGYGSAPRVKSSSPLRDFSRSPEFSPKGQNNPMSIEEAHDPTNPTNPNFLSCHVMATPSNNGAQLISHPAFYHHPSTGSLSPKSKHDNYDLPPPPPPPHLHHHRHPHHHHQHQQQQQQRQLHQRRPISENASCDYTIDELITQSINTDGWSDHTWVSNLDHHGNLDATRTARQFPSGGGVSVDTTRYSPVPFKQLLWGDDFKSSMTIATDSATCHNNSMPGLDYDKPMSSSPTPAAFQFQDSVVCFSDDFPAMQKENARDSKSSSSSSDASNSEEISPEFRRHQTSYSETAAAAGSRSNSPPCREMAVKTNADNHGSSRTLNGKDAAIPPSSYFLLFMCPELGPYNLSMYEQFPFISYEQYCVAPFLNSCVDTGDECHTPWNPLQKRVRDWCERGKSCQDYLHDNITPDSFECASNVSTDVKSSNSQQLVLRNNNSMNKLPDEDPFYIFSEQNLQMATDRLLESHRRTIGLECRSLSEMEMRTAHDMYNGMCKLRDRIHGPMKFLDRDVYCNVLEKSGVDIDKRLDFLLVYCQLIFHNLTRAIRFFRAVPGFQALHISDRVKLSRHAFHEYMILTSFRGFDAETGNLINEECMLALRNDIFQQIFPEIAVPNSVASRVVCRLKALNLTAKETVIMKAIILTRPHRREELINPALVERLHRSYYSCLRHYLRKNNPDPEERFNTIRDIMDDLYNAGTMMENTYLDQQNGGYFDILDKSLPENRNDCLKLKTSDSLIEDLVSREPVFKGGVPSTDTV